LKHGIFARTILLKSESEKAFRSLRAGLFEYLRPEGALEELLVGRLVELEWRRRRLLLAECAALENFHGGEISFESMLREVQ